MNRDRMLARLALPAVRARLVRRMTWLVPEATAEDILGDLYVAITKSPDDAPYPDVDERCDRYLMRMAINDARDRRKRKRDLPEIALRHAGVPHVHEDPELRAREAAAMVTDEVERRLASHPVLGPTLDIVKTSIERGVPEEQVARERNVNVATHRSRKRRLYAAAAGIAATLAAALVVVFLQLRAPGGTAAKIDAGLDGPPNVVVRTQPTGAPSVPPMPPIFELPDAAFAPIPAPPVDAGKPHKPTHFERAQGAAARRDWQGCWLQLRQARTAGEPAGAPFKALEEKCREGLQTIDDGFR